MAEQQGYLAKIQDWFNKANQVNVPRTPYTAAIVDKTYQNPVNQLLENVSQPARQWAKQTQGALNTAYPQATLLAGGGKEIARRGKIAGQYADTTAIPVQDRPAAYPLSQVSPAAPVPGTAASTGAGMGISDFSLANSQPSVEPGNNALTWNAPPAFSGQSATAQLPMPQQPSDALSKAMAANPVSSGRELVDVAAGGGQPYVPIFAGQSKQIGTQQYSNGTPFEPTQGLKPPPVDPYGRRLMSGTGVVSPMTTGGSDVPLYETSYYGQDGKPIATITGQNQRQGGGTLSVLGGRTPEEQAAIKEAVAGIESQTAAMRGLRNANRQEQGLMTVEQARQLSDMRQMMGGLAPPPDTRRLDEQQAALMQQLKDAQGIKGFGKRRQREAAMDAAKLGLAQLAGLRGEQNQQYGQQAGLAQSMMQNQAAQESAQAKALQDQNQWLANYGLTKEANQIAQNKNELDAAQAGARQTLDEQRYGGDTAMKMQEAARGLYPSAAEQKLWYTEDLNNPGKPTLNATATGLSALPSDKAQVQPGGIYLQGETPVRIDENGIPVPIEGGLGMAVFLNRAMQMKKLGAL